VGVSDWFFNSATAKEMAEKSKSDRWKRDPPDIIPLTVADPDFHIAPEIKTAIINAVANEELNYTYTDTSLAEKCAAKITKINGISATAEDLHNTNGVVSGMSMAVKYACKEGDEVIVNDPMYFPFRMMTEIHNAKPVIWNLDYEDNYRFDIEQLKKLITSKTKLINVCNPHNPTGRVMTKEELKGIADLAVDHDILVFSDELWEDVIFDDRKHISIASLNPEIEQRTISQYGFSKVFNTAGLKIGYLCFTNKEKMEGLRELLFSSMMVPTNLSKAAGKVMISEDMDWWRKALMSHLHKIRGLCEAWFEDLPNITYPKLEGTYLMFPKFDYGMPSEKLVEYLVKEAKVRLDPGVKFGALGEGHLRILIGTSEEIIKESLERIEKSLQKL
jgi:aminotransferase/cystathionine beta-lyase